MFINNFANFLSFQFHYLSTHFHFMPIFFLNFFLSAKYSDKSYCNIARSPWLIAVIAYRTDTHATIRVCDFLLIFFLRYKSASVVRIC